MLLFRALPGFPAAALAAPDNEEVEDTRRAMLFPLLVLDCCCGESMSEGTAGTGGTATAAAAAAASVAPSRRPVHDLRLRIAAGLVGPRLPAPSGPTETPP